MTPGTLAPRVVAVVGALGVNVLLAVASLHDAAPAPAIAWLHPLAPPLTHIPEMGEATLGPGDVGQGAARSSAQALPGGTRGPASPSGPPPGAAPQPPGIPPQGPPPLRGLAGAVERLVRTSGTPAQRAALAEVQALGADAFPRAARSTTLRLAIEADAVAIAEVLGPDRVGAVVAEKDALATRIGEGRAWATALDRLGGAAP